MLTVNYLQIGALSALSKGLHTIRSVFGLYTIGLDQ